MLTPPQRLGIEQFSDISILSATGLAECEARRAPSIVLCRSIGIAPTKTVLQADFYITKLLYCEIFVKY